MSYDLIYGANYRRSRLGSLATLAMSVLCTLPGVLCGSVESRLKSQYSRGLTKTARLPVMSDAEIYSTDPLGLFSHRSSL